MRFFGSRVSQCAAELPDHAGWLFVTSEQRDHNSPRLYTVRKCAPDGKVGTVGDFQQYATSAQAWRAIAKIVAEAEQAALIRDAANAGVAEADEAEIIRRHGTPEQRQAYGLEKGD